MERENHRIKKGGLHHRYKELLTYINNKKIREKMTYVYVFCVLVPVIMTNLVIIMNIVTVAKNEQQENLNYIADNIGGTVETALERAVSTSVDLYTSKSIKNFLDEEYNSASEYFEAYRKTFDNFLFYATSNYYISNFTLYSDNSTMNNGGKFFRIDAIKETEWYKTFTQSKKDVFVHIYYNNVIYDEKRKRIISLIRRLNYFGKRTNEKLVKIDLNYDQVYRSIHNLSNDVKVYVCSDDKIIFSNDSKVNNERDDFFSDDYVSKNQMQAHRTKDLYGSKWDIYLIGYETNYLVEIEKNFGLILALLLTDALIPAFVFGLFSSSITSRVLLLRNYLNQMKEESFELIPDNESKDEIGELLDNYNLMAIRMKELIEYEFRSKLKQQELQLARQQTELHALQSQINPHFMFNVLESIRMRSVLKGENDTSQMIESLARLMRRSATWKEDFIPLRQELTFAEDYLKLQQYRFGEEFRYKINIEEECYEFMIPSLSIVTFVENACVHGFDRTGHGGSIYIYIYKKENVFCIEIEDTGVGMEIEQVRHVEELLNHATIDDLMKSESLGMINTIIRFKKYCSENTTISIESELKIGTCITIAIPIEKDNIQGK